MSKYVTDEAMRSAMTLQKGYIDKGDSNNAEGIDSLKKGKNLLYGVLTGGVYHAGGWGSSAEASQNPTRHEIDVTEGVFSIKEAGDNYIVSSFVNVEEGKTYTFSFCYINGGAYEIHIIGGTNNHVFTGSGGGPISRSFTSVATEAVRIFIKTDDKKLKNPQLELGSTGTQFTASTEELKEYHDKDTREREATLLERVTELEGRMEEVVQTQLITTPPATLNAQVGYYYCMGGSGVVVDTMTIQLPAIADKNKTKNVQFFMTMGSAPEVTFVSAGTERILYQKDFALEAKRSYEVNALWNGHAWVITVVEIIVPPFVKLSLKNGNVVELQGSGELTQAMVLPYKSSIVSAEIGELCTSIGNNAFYYCKGLTSITISDSVTSIGSNVFYSCDRLTSVTIGSGVTSIGNQAFYYCKGLTNIVVDSANTVYDSRDNCNAIVKTSTNELIAGCKNTVIPNTVTSIGEEAFNYCTGLTSITIPDGVTSIGNGAFMNCTGLTSVTIPDGVTSIGNNAFKDCSRLTSVTIPDSVTSIGESAFRSCSSLTNITIPNSVIGDQAFYECTGLTSVTIGSGVTSIGDQAFYECTGLTSVTIGSGVTSIGGYAFSGCSGLTSIVVDSANTVYDSRDNCNALINTSTNELIKGCKNTVIPNTVASIGESAFSGCTGLTNITIPDSVTSIGNNAFKDCTGLTSVTVGNSVTSIGQSAFSGCSGLTSITIPDSVTSIGWYAFTACTGLTNITIGSGVTSIGGYAFSGCSGLTSITSLATTAPTIYSNAFTNIKTGGTLYVPSDSTGYNIWMGTGDYYLGKYNWTKVEQ